MSFYDSKDISDANADRLPKDSFPTMCEFYKYVYEIFDRLRYAEQKEYEQGNALAEEGLFQCGNERYKLLVQAPEYKEALFGKEGGR